MKFEHLKGIKVGDPVTDTIKGIHGKVVAICSGDLKEIKVEMRDSNFRHHYTSEGKYTKDRVLPALVNGHLTTEEILNINYKNLPSVPAPKFKKGDFVECDTVDGRVIGVVTGLHVDGVFITTSNGIHRYTESGLQPWAPKDGEYVYAIDGSDGDTEIIQAKGKKFLWPYGQECTVLDGDTTWYIEPIIGLLPKHLQNK